MKVRPTAAFTGEVKAALLSRHAACDFVRAMSYPGVALVRQMVTRVGRSSVEMNLVLEKKDEPGVVYATGRTVIVWYDYAAGKSKPWPEAIRETIT